MMAAEPERWAGEEPAALAASLDLGGAARRMLEHHREVLGTQLRSYARAAHAAATPTHRERQAFLKALNADMDELDASMASLDGWAAGDAAPEAEVTGFGGGGGGGGGGKGKGGKAKKNKKKR